ncbi:MAG TPA: hypothetical protein VFW11_09640 [Cyclobacteriaceae bacterium]|nr:hypothetical protein [Cyclobacteriaceae bacterium]
MLIRKNTKAFKTILEIISTCQHRGDREKLIRLYIAKAGHTVLDRIAVEGMGDAALFYEMNYQTVLNSLRSSNHQLHVSDEIPGVYFFRSNSNKAWDETPFEFDEAIKKELSALPELPVLRKKEKLQKSVIQIGKSKAASTGKKEKAELKKSAITIPEKGPRQPNYKLRHKIHFSDLDKIIFRQPQGTRQDILDYYNKIAEYILPYLKDRPLFIRSQLGKGQPPIELSVEGLFKDNPGQLPEWVQSTTLSVAGEKRKMLLCNDKEHLLFYVGMGCLEFSPCHSRIKSVHSPDYLVLVIDSPDEEGAKLTEVAAATGDILKGLQLPSFLKTDGMSGLHAYVPLDSKSTFETSRMVAEYICKLVALKIPDRVSLKGIDGYIYGRVLLDASVNMEGANVVAPYSLVADDAATVATPLCWDEPKMSATVGSGAETWLELKEKIFKRIKQAGDPFKALFKKKQSADSLLDRLEKNYAFLFP